MVALQLTPKMNVVFLKHRTEKITNMHSFQPNTPECDGLMKLKRKDEWTDWSSKPIVYCDFMVRLNDNLSAHECRIFIGGGNV